MVRALRAAGADANARDLAGNAPVHLAVFHWGGRMDTLRALFERPGVAVDVKNDEGRTALFVASSEPHFEDVVHLLRQHGADPFLAALQRPCVP